MDWRDELMASYAKVFHDEEWSESPQLWIWGGELITPADFSGLLQIVELEKMTQAIKAIPPLKPMPKPVLYPRVAE